LIWLVVVILLGLWVIGFVADVAAGLIHLLLLAAVIALVYKFFLRRSDLI